MNELHNFLKPTTPATLSGVGSIDLNSSQHTESPAYQSPLRSEQNLSTSDLLLVPISFAAIVWVVLFIMHFNFWKSVRNRLGHLPSVSQLPCTNCKYFKNNPYLKCAVQPDRVLRTEATECPDYCGNDEVMTH